MTDRAGQNTSLPPSSLGHTEQTPASPLPATGGRHETVRWGNSTAGTTYSITDLAQEFDLTPRAIRYYEDKGLLHPIREGTKRIYRRRDRTRLKLIMRAKRLGISLDDARELFELYDQMQGEARQLHKFLNILAERRATLEQQRRDIEATLEEIDTIEAECHRRLKQEGQTD